jgi:2-polyprenyl-6-methoxyphenol hydroxylase-like FAD-dependent oxidoreductase
MKCFCISEESVMPHVIVIGAGITGVTSAYELSQLGYQVTVIDRIFIQLWKHHLQMEGNYLLVMQKSGTRKRPL